VLSQSNDGTIPFGVGADGAILTVNKNAHLLHEFPLILVIRVFHLSPLRSLTEAETPFQKTTS